MRCQGATTVSDKREIKRIEWNIVKRIISILYYDVGIKKTNISMKSGLGYDKCTLYLDWMDMMELIVREDDDRGFQLIKLSQRGKNLYETYFRDVSVVPVLETKAKIL